METTLAEEVSKLSDLLDLGFLQDEEYQVRKKEIELKYSSTTSPDPSQYPPTPIPSNNTPTQAVRSRAIPTQSIAETPKTNVVSGTDLFPTSYPVNIPSVDFSTTDDIVWSTNSGSKSDSLVVSNDGKIVVNKGPSAGSLNIIRAEKGWDKGIHRWKIYIEIMEPDSVVIIGVGRPTINRNTHVGGGSNGWGYICNGQKIFCNSAMKYEPEGYKQGDVIGVVVDCDEGTITFHRNDKAFPCAFRDVKGLVYPVLSVPGPLKGASSKIFPCLRLLEF